MGADLSLGLALLDGRSCLGIFEEQRASNLLTLNGFGRPAIGVLAAHGPPCFVRAIAIDGSLSGDGDVFLAIGIDAWLVVHQVHALPTCLHNGEELRVEGKEQRGTLLKIEVHVALQRDRTRRPCTCWHHHASATCLRTGSNGLVNGRLVLRWRGFQLCAIFCDVEVAIGKLRFVDAVFNLPIGAVVPSLCRDAQGHDHHRKE